MRVKSKLSIVAFFSCCAVASMGFANWVISQGAGTVSVTGDIFSDNIVVSNEYFYMDGTPSGLDCTYSGFREPDDPANPFKDTLETNYIIDLDKCYQAFGEATVTATIKLSYSSRVSTSDSTNIFRPNNRKYIESKVIATGIEIPKHSISSTSFVNSANVSDYAYTVTFEFTISETTKGKANISVNYTFDLLNETNFNNYIYNPLKTVARTFVFDAQLKGGK